MNNNQNSWAIYIRSATGNMESLQEQKDICEKFLQNMQPTSIVLYEGNVASNMDQLQRLIQDIKDGKINGVIVSKLHRLTRSLVDFVYFFNGFFEEHNVSFISVAESFDNSTAAGKFTLKILKIFAEFELKERARFFNLPKDD